VGAIAPDDEIAAQDAAVACRAQAQLALALADIEAEELTAATHTPAQGQQRTFEGASV
jgi:hypothetical protein